MQTAILVMLIALMVVTVVAYFKQIVALLFVTFVAFVGYAILGMVASWLAMLWVVLCVAVAFAILFDRGDEQ